jgi:hypothetical protein
MFLSPSHVDVDLSLTPIAVESGRPAFFCRSFFWALLQANSCVLQLRAFCFPGSALNPMGPSHKCSRSLWKQKPLASVCPRKWGRKRRHFHVLLIINSVTLVGFVGSDPEQRQAKGTVRSSPCSPSLHNAHGNADDEGSSKTEWHRPVLMWNLSPCQRSAGRR